MADEKKPPVATLTSDEVWEEDGEEKLHYLYNRGERLKSAPKIVQDYYQGKGPNLHRGLFGWLVATKANRFMLMVLCITMCVYILVGIFARNSNEAVLNKVVFSLSAFRNADNVYLTLESKTQKDPRALRGSLRGKSPKTKTPLLQEKKNFLVEFSYIDTDGQEARFGENYTLDFIGEEKKLATNTKDYDIIYIKALVKDNTSGDSISIKATVR